MAIAPFIFVTFLIGTLALGGMTFGSMSSVDVGSALQAGQIKINVGVVSFFLFALMVAFLLAIIWIWRRNIVIVTNQHLVDMDQTGLFNRVVSTQSLGRIQDVKSQINGPLQTIFQYGTIVVQTAGESQNFSFDYIPRPYEVERFILEAHQKFMQENGGTSDDGVSPFEKTSDNERRPENNDSPPPPPPNSGNNVSRSASSSSTPPPATPPQPEETSTPLDDLINN